MRAGSAISFRSERDFSVWIGLVPRQNSSGGKERVGNITKQGDRYLLSLFTIGALAVIQYVKVRGAIAPYSRESLGRSGAKAGATMALWPGRTLGRRAFHPLRAPFVMMGANRAAIVWLGLRVTRMGALGTRIDRRKHPREPAASSPPGDPDHAQTCQIRPLEFGKAQGPVDTLLTLPNF